MGCGGYQGHTRDIRGKGAMGGTGKHEGTWDTGEMGDIGDTRDSRGNMGPLGAWGPLGMLGPLGKGTHIGTGEGPVTSCRE